MFKVFICAFLFLAAPAFSFMEQNDFDDCYRQYLADWSRHAGVYLAHQQSEFNSDTEARTHTYAIQSMTDPESPLQPALETVGQVKLLDFKEEDEVFGHIALDLILIFDDFQGKGFGSKALKEVITLVQHLAHKDDDYRTLHLQCADETSSGTKLGKVPHRLRYYLNAGFNLHHQTRQYMRHLCLNYFVLSLNPNQFRKYIRYYMPVEHSELVTRQSRQILKKLKSLATITGTLTDEHILELAESSSSDAAQRVLDRVYYDATITSREQGASGTYLYLMSMDVLRWEESKVNRRLLLSSRGTARSYDEKEDAQFQSLILSHALQMDFPISRPKRKSSGKENNRRVPKVPRVEQEIN